MNKRIVVSGASGDLGRRITRALLERVPAENLTLVTRTPERLADETPSGVQIRRGDFRVPESLAQAYHGNDALMLISGMDVSNRVPQHKSAIDAAKSAGIQHIVYTSTAGVHPQNPTLSAQDHIRTERDLHDSGLSFTILRNQSYSEVFPTIAVKPALENGKFHHVEGNGSLAPVSKQDITACAVECLLDQARHGGAVYEITGAELVTFRQIVKMMSRYYDRPIEYVGQTVEERYAYFDALGVPRRYREGMASHPHAHLWCSEEMVTAEMAFEADFHALLSHHVRFITGRDPAPLDEIFQRCKGLDYNACP